MRVQKVGIKEQVEEQTAFRIKDVGFNKDATHKIRVFYLPLLLHPAIGKEKPKYATRIAVSRI